MKILLTVLSIKIIKLAPKGVLITTCINLSPEAELAVNHDVRYCYIGTLLSKVIDFLLDVAKIYIMLHQALLNM
jgi:hypothetical protein